MSNNKIFWIKVLVTLILIVGSLWYLYPTYQLNKLSDTEIEELKTRDPEKYSNLKDREINLGLDLQGGLHLVLEVDTSNLTDDEAKDAPERALEVIRNRIDAFGVAEPSITLGEGGRIIIQLPGVDDIGRAKDLIQGTAQLTFQILTPADKYRGFFDAVDQLLVAEGYTAPEEFIEQQKDKEISDLIDGNETDTTTAEPATTEADTTVTALADDTTTVAEAETDTTPAETAALEIDERPFTSRLVSIGYDPGVTDKYYDWMDEIINRADVQALVPPGNKIYWGSEETAKEGPMAGRTVRPFYFVQEKIELTGEGLEDAMVMFNDSDPRNAGKPYVQMRFNRKSQAIFADVTGEHVGERMAIILDDIVQSAPTIQERINSPSSRITGNFSTEEAKDLAIVLRAGALPAPLQIMEERTVGPSLGHDSIEQGVKSTLFGGFLVVVFMVVWYRYSGFVAIVALVLNILFIFAALAALGATLTLPGIAGIILTIGMAVDANVLIFERIREEIRNNKTIRAAIDAGYARAFWTIFDANLTTFITAVVLFQFGTGPIKGFAITLMFGILISFFTAIVITRLVFDYITGRWQIKQLSI